MQHSIFTVSLTSRWRSTLIWSISMALLALMFAALYESFAGEIEDMADIAPAAMEAIWGGNLDYVDTPAGWLGLELYGIFLPMVLAIIGVSSGASAIGNEEDSGTLELLLASPVGRTRIVVEKYLSVSAQLAIIGISVWFGVALGTLLFPFEVSLTHVLGATLMGWLFGTTISSFTMCVQSIIGKKGVAIGFGAGFVASSYIANILSKLINGVSYLKYVSIFYYYDGANVLIEGLKIESVMVLLASSIITFIISIRFFRVRDTGV